MPTPTHTPARTRKYTRTPARTRARTPTRSHAHPARRAARCKRLSTYERGGARSAGRRPRRLRPAQRPARPPVRRSRAHATALAEEGIDCVAAGGRLAVNDPAARPAASRPVARRRRVADRSNKGLTMHGTGQTRVHRRAWGPAMAGLPGRATRRVVNGSRAARGVRHKEGGSDGPDPSRESVGARRPLPSPLDPPLSVWTARSQLRAGGADRRRAGYARLGLPRAEPGSDLCFSEPSFRERDGRPGPSSLRLVTGRPGCAQRAGRAGPSESAEGLPPPRVLLRQRGGQAASVRPQQLRHGSARAADQSRGSSDQSDDGRPQ